MAKVDLIGQRFGRITVIAPAPSFGSGARWLCQCDCGNQSITYANGLVGGSSKSCGCLKRELSLIALNTHGREPRRLYNIWINMRRRCSSPNSSQYRYYGERGIAVCEDWFGSFEAFRDWSLSNGYEDYLSIDRVDNDGNYEPSNCRWATAVQQANNKRPRNSVV